MNEFDEECLNVFLENQSQLFEEAVAETLEDAEAFLEDCMAVVVENIDEVKEFLEEEGMDIQGMSDEEHGRSSRSVPDSGRKISDCGRLKSGAVKCPEKRLKQHR